MFPIFVLTHVSHLQNLPMIESISFEVNITPVMFSTFPSRVFKVLSGRIVSNEHTTSSARVGVYAGMWGRVYSEVNRRRHVDGEPIRRPRAHFC